MNLAHLLVVVLLHFESSGVLREGLLALDPDLPRGGILFANSVYLGVASANAVNSILPLAYEVLPLSV